MAVGQSAHRLGEDRLLQNVIVARLLAPEVKRARQPFECVVGARIVCRHVHLGGFATPAGAEVQRHVLPVADVAAEVASGAQTFAEQLRYGKSSQRAQIQRADRFSLQKLD